MSWSSDKRIVGLDCTEDFVCHVFIFAPRSVFEKKYSARAQDALACIDETLAVLQLAKEHIAGMIVATGHGSFMSSRISVSVINGWAQALSVPACAVAVEDFPQTYDQAAARIAGRAEGGFAIAQYSGEPNIRPKKM